MLKTFKRIRFYNIFCIRTITIFARIHHKIKTLAWFFPGSSLLLISVTNSLNSQCFLHYKFKTTRNWSRYTFIKIYIVYLNLIKSLRSGTHIILKKQPLYNHQADFIGILSNIYMHFKSLTILSIPCMVSFINVNLISKIESIIIITIIIFIKSPVYKVKSQTSFLAFNFELLFSNKHYAMLYKKALNKSFNTVMVLFS